jgi:hypothetical protein
MDLLRQLRFLLLPLALLAAGMAAGAGLEWEAPLSLDGSQTCPSRITPRPAERTASAVLFPVPNEPSKDAAAPAPRAAQPVRLLIHRFNE